MLYHVVNPRDATCDYVLVAWDMAPDLLSCVPCTPSSSEEIGQDGYLWELSMTRCLRFLKVTLALNSVLVTIACSFSFRYPPRPGTARVYHKGQIYRQQKCPATNRL